MHIYAYAHTYKRMKDERRESDEEGCVEKKKIALVINGGVSLLQTPRYLAPAEAFAQRARRRCGKTHAGYDAVALAVYVFACRACGR